MRILHNDKFFKAIIMFFGIIFFICAIFPFLWAFYTSLRPSTEVYEFTINLSNLTLDSYKEIINKYPIGRWYLNSIIIATIVTFFTVLINAACGYALARIDFKGSKVIFMGILAIMMIPGQILMIPIYIMISKAGLLNTYAGITIPFLFSSFTIFLFRQYFLAMPKELEESAFIDGLSRIRIFFRVALPLAKSVIIIQVILSFIGNWNSFIYPNLILTSQEMYTLPLGMKLVEGEYFSFPNDLMAASMMMTIPIIIIYMTVSERLKDGISTTGGK